MDTTKQLREFLTGQMGRVAKGELPADQGMAIAALAEQAVRVFELERLTDAPPR